MNFSSSMPALIPLPTYSCNGKFSARSQFVFQSEFRQRPKGVFRKVWNCIRSSSEDNGQRVSSCPMRRTSWVSRTNQLGRATPRCSLEKAPQLWKGEKLPFDFHFIQFRQPSTVGNAVSYPAFFCYQEFFYRTLSIPQPNLNRQAHNQSRSFSCTSRIVPNGPCF